LLITAVVSCGVAVGTPVLTSPQNDLAGTYIQACIANPEVYVIDGAGGFEWRFPHRGLVERGRYRRDGDRIAFEFDDPEQEPVTLVARTYSSHSLLLGDDVATVFFDNPDWVATFAFVRSGEGPPIDCDARPGP
jgi:hypothetical protein